MIKTLVDLIKEVKTFGFSRGWREEDCLWHFSTPRIKRVLKTFQFQAWIQDCLALLPLWPWEELCGKVLAALAVLAQEPLAWGLYFLWPQGSNFPTSWKETYLVAICPTLCKWRTSPGLPWLGWLLREQCGLFTGQSMRLLVALLLSL